MCCVTFLLIMFSMPCLLFSAEALLENTSSGTYQLLENAVLRSKPQKTARKVGTLEKGTTIEVQEITESGWAMVMNNKKKAYVESFRLKKLAGAEKAIAGVNGQLAGFKKMKFQDQFMLVWGVLFTVTFMPLPYMIYRNMVKRFKPIPYEQLEGKAGTVATLKMRSALGVQNNEEAVEKAAQLVLEAFNSWSEVGDDARSPTTLAQLRQSGRLLKQAQQLCPVHQDAVNGINELGQVLNEQDKRTFAGSFAILVFFIGSSVLLGLIQYSSVMSKSGIYGAILFVLVGISFPLTYWLSQREPQWRSGDTIAYLGSDFVKSALENSGSGTVTRTTYANGRTTEHFDNAGANLALFAVGLTFAINMALLPVRMITGIWRNYVRA